MQLESEEPAHGAFAQKDLLDEQSQRDGFFSQFHKTIMGDGVGKQMAHMPADLFLIEMLQTTVAGVMEKYHDKHNFSL